MGFPVQPIMPIYWPGPVYHCFQKSKYIICYLKKKVFISIKPLGNEHFEVYGIMRKSRKRFILNLREINMSWLLKVELKSKTVEIGLETSLMLNLSTGSFMIERYWHDQSQLLFLLWPASFSEISHSKWFRSKPPLRNNVSHGIVAKVKLYNVTGLLIFYCQEENIW